MKNRIYCLPLSVFAALLFIAIGCNSLGSEYLGSWENSKNSNEQIEITRNGETFLIKVARPGRNPLTVPGTFKNGSLEVKGDLLTSHITYLKSTDTLIMPAALNGDVEFRRRK